MTFDRFTALVRTYGPDAGRWPARWQTLYARHADTPAGRAVLAAESRFEADLAAYAVPETASPALAERLRALAAADDELPAGWERLFWRLSAFSCAACLAAGLLVGLLWGDGALGRHEPENAWSQLVFGVATSRGETYDALFAR